MYRIRRVEEEVARLYPTGRIKSPVHLSIGQEAVAVGVCEALRADDVVFGTYRSHALYLAKGGDIRRMIAELYGKATGCARGKGGSMHLVDVACGMMGTSAVVGTTIPNAVGYAYALKYRRSDRIVVSFFGDGAVEEGVFHESLNFASLKRLPIIFVCENNGYAIHSPLSARQANTDFVERAKSHNIAACRIEDNDVLAVFDRTREAVEAVRTGRSAPVLFECVTYRWLEHVGPNEDVDLGYRDRHEVDLWIERDQVRKVASIVDPTVRASIDAEVEHEIEDAFAFAEASPFPEPPELDACLFKKRE